MIGGRSNQTTRAPSIICNASKIAATAETKRFVPLREERHKRRQILVQLFFGKGELIAMFSVPKWQLIGGILGAFYVFVMVLIVPKVGVANSLMAVVAGQLVMSSIVDHFGLFGGQRIPFDLTRFAAIGFLFLALWLFFRK